MFFIVYVQQLLCQLWRRGAKLKINLYLKRLTIDCGGPVVVKSGFNDGSQDPTDIEEMLQC